MSITAISLRAECLPNPTVANFAYQYGLPNGLFGDCTVISGYPQSWSRSGYTPGICPSSWTPGTPTVNGATTTVPCCVSGSALVTSVSGHATGYCPGSLSTAVSVYTLTDSTGGLFGTTISPGSFNWPMLLVSYMSDDLEDMSPSCAALAMTEGVAFTPTSACQATSPTSTPAPVTVTQFQTLTPTTIPSRTPTSLNSASAAGTSDSPSSSNSSSGLSTGAKAGIGIGAAIGGILLIAGGVLLGLRMGRKRGLFSGGPPGRVNDAQPEISENRVGNRW